MKELLEYDGLLSKDFSPITLSIWSPTQNFMLNVGEASASVYLGERDSLWMEFDASKDTWKYVKGTSIALNKKIIKLDSLCDNSLLKFSMLPAAKRMKEMRYFADTLRNSTPFNAADFYSVYLRYRTVYCEIVTDVRKRSDLARLHFSQPPYVNNPAYMEAFRALFSGFVRQKLNGPTGDSLKQAMLTANHFKYWSELKRDTNLQDETVRDLIGLLGIYEEASNKQFDRKVLIELTRHFDSIEEEPEVSSIAKLMLYDWERFQKGKIVPDFSYQMNGERKQLSSLRGKPVYLCYYPVFDEETRRELLMLKGMYTRYKTEMNFLVVVRTSAQAALSRANAELSTGFDIVSFADCSPEFIEICEQSLARTYMLIDRKGAIFQAPAEGPETGVEAAFLNLIKR
jgi:peroxiredoxin